MEVGKIYYCYYTKAIFQCIYRDEEEQNIYVCNPANDSEAALLRVPEPKFRVLEALNSSYTIPGEEWGDYVEESIWWARTFRFHNRIFYGKEENMEYCALEEAADRNFVRECFIFDGVYESVKYLYSSDSPRSFKQANELKNMILMHQMKWLTENRKMVTALINLEPKKEIPFRANKRRK